MAKFTQKKCYDEALDTLLMARKEAVLRGETINIINIGITLYEFAKGWQVEPVQDNNKPSIGFVEVDNG